MKPSERGAGAGAGVDGIGLLLRAVADGAPSTVAETAAALALARSTAFGIAALLAEAGFIERDAAGRLLPGAESGRLGLAFYGFGALSGPAEALLSTLRDDADATVALRISDDTAERTVIERRAPWDNAPDADGVELRAPIACSALGYEAAVALRLRPHAGLDEQEKAAACLGRVAAALAGPLAEGKAPVRRPSPRSSGRADAHSAATRRAGET